MKKRILSAFLTLVMLLSLMPATALAADNTVPVVTNVTAALNPSHDFGSVIFGELEVKNGVAIKSMEIELYSNTTKIATTNVNNVNNFLDAGNTYTLSWHILVKSPAGKDPDAYWTTKWENGHPVGDAVPTHIVTYVNGVNVGETPVTSNYDGGTIVTAWTKLPGVKVAKIGDAYYESLQDAIDDAGESGDTITLLGDVDEKGTEVEEDSGEFFVQILDKDITIDLGGFTFAGSLYLNSGAKLTIDNGYIVSYTDNKASCIESVGGSLVLGDKLDAHSSYRHCIRVKGGSAEINGGTYKTTAQGDITAHALNIGGSGIVSNVTINNGTFMGSKGFSTATSGNAVMIQNNESVVNIYNGDFSNAIGVEGPVSVAGGLTIYNGSFDDWYTGYNKFVTETKAVVYNETTKRYVMSDAAARVVEDQKSYATLESAIGGATAGKTVKLLADAEKDFSLDKSLTLALGTYKLVSTITADENVKLTVSGTNADNNILLAALEDKTGYTFGWYVGDTKADAVNDGFKVVPAAEAKTYEAKYIPITYGISYELNGGAAGENAPEEHTYGIVTELVSPTKTGYTFAGWYTDAEFNTKVESLAADGYTADIKLFAKWTINQYTITFNTAGGNTIAPITGDYGAAIPAVADPVKTGYTFTGWINEDGHATTVPATIPAQNMTITATWSIGTYTISFNTDGGSSIDAIKGEYNTAVTAPGNPTKTGYTFAGWVDAEGNATTVPEKMPGSNITLKANWTANKYTVTFNANGGTCATANREVSYDAAYGELPTATLADNKFVGWFTAAEGGTQITAETIVKITKNTTLYAQWTPKATATPVLDAQTYTYDGELQTFAISGTPADKYAVQYKVDGSYTETAPVKAGTYDVKLSREGDDNYLAYEKEITGGLVINTAPLTVTAENKTAYVGDANAPELTFKVDGLVKGDSFSSPAMAYETTPDLSKTGEVAIKISGGTLSNRECYDVTYVAGKLTISERPTSSTPSAPSTETTTTTNPDGSVTTTVTDKVSGTVTEITEHTDGSTTEVETKTDGTVTTTETRADKVKVETVEQPDKDTAATVTLPAAVASATVTLPVEAAPGTVAVDAETGEVVKFSVPTDDGLAVKLDGSAQLIIKDNSKEFSDTEGHWADNAIDFATARELYQGTSETEFTPNGAMTRAMLMTVLARLDSQDTESGDTWYANGMDWAVETGISDGSAAMENISREQMITMLWRYAKLMGMDLSASGDLNAFGDAGDTSAWAQEAMQWAVGKGIIGGKPGNVLDPEGNATRAEVATIIQRFVTLITK